MTIAGHAEPAQTYSSRNFPALIAFVDAYFANERVPVVVLEDVVEADAIAVLALDLPWPNLRAIFTMCTHALQPRSLDGQPFSLLVAPREAMSRFSRVPRENLIGYAAGQPDPATIPAATRSFLSGRSALGDTTLSRLWQNLPPDPGAFRRTITIDELRLRALDTPSAALAALDVLAVLAPKREDAIEEKERSLLFALEKVQAAPCATRAELLAALSLRCRRPAFSPFAALRKRIRTALASEIAAEPAAGLSLLSKGTSIPVSTVIDVAKGLVEAPASKLEGLPSFASEHPSRMRELLRARPGIAVAYLARVELAGHARSEIDVEVWYADTDPRRRGGLTRLLSTSPLAASRASLLRKVLEDVPPREMEAVLAAQLAAEPPKHTLAALADFTSRFPEAALRALRSIGVRTPSAGRLLGGVLPLGPEAISILETLDDESARCGVESSLSAYLGRPGALTAVADRLSTVATQWVLRLVRSRCPPDESTASAINVMVRKFPLDDMALLAQPDDEQKKVWRKATSSLGEPLARSATKLFIEGRISEQTAFRWKATRTFGEGIRRLALPGLLREILEQDADSAQRAARLWRWLHEVEPLLARDRDVEQLLGLIFEASRDAWPAEAVDLWLDSLLRRKALSFQALALALENIRLPLSPIVVASFPHVYTEAISDRHKPLFERFLFFADWDKGKDLRRRLIEAYSASGWPPGDLALLAHQSGILKKVVSRSLRSNLEPMMHNALQELLERCDPEATEAAQEMTSLLASGNPEDWD